MNRKILVLGAVILIAGGSASPADASTASRLQKLERQAKAQTVVNAQLRGVIASDRARIDGLERAVTAAATLLLNCFQSTSMDLDATTSYLSGSPFIAPSLNSSAAGPFYLATLNPACVGAITPPMTPTSARSSQRLFPTAHLAFPALP